MVTVSTGKFRAHWREQKLTMFSSDYTLLEILSFSMYYDSSQTKFVDLIQENRIVVATYTQLAYDVANLSR